MLILSANDLVQAQIEPDDRELQCTGIENWAGDIIGVDDGFDDGNIETTNARPVLNQYFGQIFPNTIITTNYDNTNDDNHFLESLAVPAPAGEIITRALVIIRTRPTDIRQAANDWITLSPAHVSQFEPISYRPNQNDTIFQIDLAAAQPIVTTPSAATSSTADSDDVLSGIGNFGFLDIHVQDDTSVDYIQLETCSVSPPVCPGSFPNTVIATSVHGQRENGSDAYHGSTGLPRFLNYPSVITNQGGAWSAAYEDTFHALCAGTYHFSWSFVKDSYYTDDANKCEAGQGTVDDVSVTLWNNGALIPGYEASSGQNTGERGTGAASAILNLKEGDKITTVVEADYFGSRSRTRCLKSYNFNAHRIGN